MNIQKVISVSTQAFIVFSVLSIGYVSVLSLINPHATMAMVNVTLSSNDAVSSIRGIYGGVGMVITLSLIYLLLKNIRNGLVFLGMFWGAYALSRTITILADGPLGEFGSQWLMIEATLFVVAMLLLFFSRKYLKNA